MNRIPMTVLRIIVLCGVVALAQKIYAYGTVAEDIDFSVGVPEGWQYSDGSWLSPEYSGAISRIAVGWTALSGETVSVATTSGAALASFDAGAVTSAVLNVAMPGLTRFRISCPEQTAIGTCSLAWMDGSLAAPVNLVVSENYTGDSFALSWNSVDGADRYRVEVWTNRLEGASSGTLVWRETFANATNVPGKTSASYEGKMDEHSDNAGWIAVKVYAPSQGGDGFVRLGNSSETGFLISTNIVLNLDSSEGLVLRWTAWQGASPYGKPHDVYRISPEGETNLVAEVALSGTPASFAVPLSDFVDNDRLMFRSVTNGTRNVMVGGIEIVSGYSEGTLVPVLVKDQDVFGMTSCVLENLPSEQVFVKVVAIGGDGTESPDSEAIPVDLSKPQKRPVPALNVSEIAESEGYNQNFDAIAGGGWVNGLTLEGWSAYAKAGEITQLTEKSAAGGQPAGLYAYHEANSKDMSLAGVSKSNNQISFGFAVTNDTQGVMENISLGFAMRQWTLSGDRTAAQTFKAEYLVTNSVVSLSASGDWQEIETMSAVGNLADAGARKTVENALADVDVPGGSVLLVRFVPEKVANGEAFGIDNLSLSCSVRYPKQGLTIRLANNRP